MIDRWIFRIPISFSYDLIILCFDFWLLLLLFFSITPHCKITREISLWSHGLESVGDSLVWKSTRLGGVQDRVSQGTGESPEEESDAYYRGRCGSQCETCLFLLAFASLVIIGALLQREGVARSASDGVMAVLLPRRVWQQGDVLIPQEKEQARPRHSSSSFVLLQLLQFGSVVLHTDRRGSALVKWPHANQGFKSSSSSGEQLSSPLTRRLCRIILPQGN